MRLSLLLISFYGAAVSSTRCTTPTLRKEIRELSPDELTRLTNAVNQLHHTRHPTINNLSQYEYFTKIHFENVPNAHEVPAFLPWHRHFLRKFEVALQAVDPSVSLPYWDWSLDSQQPHRSVVLTPAYFGGNGERTRDGCLMEGPFGNWTLRYPTPHCLRRTYDQGDRVSALSYPEELLLYLNQAKFSDFSLLVEEKHAYPHLFVGGKRGDFRPMWSPNDPLFFLHHTFIDYIWFLWQRRHPSANPYEGDRYRMLAGPDDVLVPFHDVKVRSLLDTASDAYCYTYSEEYPRLTYSRCPTKRVKQRAREELNSNMFINGPLQNSTMQEALVYLRERYGGKELNGQPKLTPVGPFSMQEIKEIGFTMPHEVKSNSDDSVELVGLLNRTPKFRSLARFHH